MPTALEDYVVLYTIGSGSYGTCKKIQRKKDKKILVWKEMDYGTMSEDEKQLLVSEVNLLRELRHPNIVRYYDRIIDKAKTRIYIVMEYCEGGDLSHLITKCRREGHYLEEDFVWTMFVQLLKALSECHKRRNGKTVLHRDLKPANVFLDANRCAKLGDFGLARVLTHDTSMATTFVGTPYYMSPEQMNRASYNDKSDVWSLGCLLHELCALRPPFTAANQKELALKIRHGRPQRIPARYSDELATLIQSMLKVTGEDRPTIDSLLSHSAVLRKLSREHDNRNNERRRASDVTTSGGSSDDSEKKDKEKDLELRAREERIRERERELERRDERLKLREMQVDNLERALQQREVLAEEKLKRAEALLREAKNQRNRSPATPPSRNPRTPRPESPTRSPLNRNLEGRRRSAFFSPPNPLYVRREFIEP